MGTHGRASTFFERFKCTASATLGTCALCDARTTQGAICKPCLANLPRPKGRPKANFPFIDAFEAACLYAFPLDSLIQSFKFHRDLAALKACETAFVSNVSIHSHFIDLVVPVPLNRRRYVARGFNQSAVLAQALAQKAALPFSAGLVCRSGYQRPQSELDAVSRSKNVRGIFKARRRLAGEHVLVVDDVVSTGATVAELARVLRSAGAARVSVAALAVNQVVE